MGITAAWRRPLTSHVTFAGDGGTQPGWSDFLAREQLCALWDYDLLQSLALSPDPFCPTFTAAVRHHDEIVGVFVGSFRGLRPTVAPGRIGPLVADMRMPGQAHEASWHLRSDLDPARQQSVIAEFERGLLAALGRSRLAGIAYRNVCARTAPALQRVGAIRREANGPGTVLPLPDTYQEYLAGLSKKRRKSLRRGAAAIEERTRVEFSTKRTDLDPVEVAELYRGMSDRYPPMRLDPRPQLPAEYFRRLLDREDVCTISYHADGRLMAVGTLMRHPVTPWGAYWAMVHPSEGGVPHLYFDHYARYVRYAIEEEGASGLSSGRGLVAEKQSVGYQVIPLSFVGVTRPFLG